MWCRQMTKKVLLTKIKCPGDKSVGTVPYKFPRACPGTEVAPRMSDLAKATA